MLDKHVRRNNVLCMEHAVALGGRVGQVFWSLTFWLKDLHPSTIRTDTVIGGGRGCMYVAPTGTLTLQPVGGIERVAAGSSHLLGLVITILVVLITTCCYCVQRVCAWLGSKRPSIKLPSGFEISIHGAH